MSNQEGLSGGGQAAFVAFAKNPELVPVKTRLANTLGQEQARKLYLALLEDCLASLKSIKSVKHYLAVYPDVTGKLLPDLAAKYDFSLVEQEGEDLGERMLNCVKTLLSSHLAVIIFGTDMPELPLSGIEKTLSQMEQWNVLLGPSRDGGYWAFGANKVHDRMFDGIQWGGDSVFVETVKNCARLGLEVSFLDISEDIDDQQSLGRFCKWLAQRKDGAPASREVLKELGLLVGRES